MKLKIDLQSGWNVLRQMKELKDNHHQKIRKCPALNRRHLISSKDVYAIQSRTLASFFYFILTH